MEEAPVGGVEEEAEEEEDGRGKEVTAAVG
jgi:hypothetical protein